MIRKMTGWCVALAALALIGHSSFNGPGTTLSTRAMKESRGADPGSADCNVRCDMAAGVYVGCTAVNGTCRQCGTFMMGMTFISYASALGEPGDPGCSPNGGFMDSAISQNCKDILQGTCTLNPDNPTGYSCVGVDTQLVCSDGVLYVIDQPLMGSP
jgi:hypothetical protein